MSLYLKAWLFLGSTVLLLITLPLWQPLVERAFGPTWSHFALVSWGMLGIVGYYLFSCPECGCSLMRTEGRFLNIFHPWPDRKCSRCGRDHTI